MCKLNERGYTFIEALLQLVVVGIFASSIIFCMHYLYNFTYSAYAKEETEWELFVQDFESYLYDVVDVKSGINHTSIYVEKRYGVIIFGNNRDLIRKQIDGLGHEPVLMRVANAYYYVEGNIVTINVTFLNGLQKERSWYVEK